MSNVVIKFNSPILQPGENFLISYEDINTSIVTVLPTKTDNSDLILNLPIGRYRFSIQVVKEDGTECPIHYVDYEVYPPPTEPPVEPPVDPPITDPEPCKCPIVTDARIVKECSGVIYLKLWVTYPTSNLPCFIKLWHRNNGVNNSQVSYTISNFDPVLSFPINNANNLQYRLGMVCCTNDTESICKEWEDVKNIDECSCSAPNISIVSTQQAGTGLNVLVNISASSPNLPPYTVSFGSGTYSISQTYNSAGQQLFNIPVSFSSGIIKVSNQCGENQVPITQMRCKNIPSLAEVAKALNGSSMTIKWWGDGISSYTVELFAYGSSVPSYSAVVPHVGLSNVIQQHTFLSMNPSFVSGLVTVKVTDNCGVAINNY